MNHYEKLANAIVLQAVRDWRDGSEENKREVERFFRSSWFSVLTRLEPDILISKLRKELSE